MFYISREPNFRFLSHFKNDTKYKHKLNFLVIGRIVGWMGAIKSAGGTIKNEGTNHPKEILDSQITFL
jgi:hypothetical protein